jgi:spore coat protein CotF
MEYDFLDPINAVGMPELADSALALDFLLSAKNGVRNCAVALTEAITPEVRTFLRSQLHESLALHQEISELMMRKKWFHPYELHEQYQLDMLSANNTVQIAQLKLFPDDNTRKGLFDRTPDE